MHLSRKFGLLIFLLIVLFCMSNFAQAEAILFTEVTADITEDTIWTKTESPYIVKNSVSVFPGVTLTIEPGVVVKFDQGEFFFGNSLNIDGSLSVLGTPENPVYFTSNFDDEVGGNTDDEEICYEDIDEEGNVVGEICESFDLGDPLAGDWDGIYFDNSNSVLKNLRVRYADDALALRDSDVDFQNLNVENSIYGLSSYGNSKIEVAGGIFDNLERDAIGSYGNGSLTLEGVNISNIYGDAFGLYGGSLHASTLTVKNISFGSALGVYAGDVVIEDSIFEEGLDAGIDLYGGSINLRDSLVSEYLSGNLVLYGGTATLERLEIKDTDYGISVYGGVVTLSKSSFAGILVNAVENYSDSIVEARNNYWGDPSGPYEAG